MSEITHHPVPVPDSPQHPIGNGNGKGNGKTNGAAFTTRTLRSSFSLLHYCARDKNETVTHQRGEERSWTHSPGAAQPAAPRPRNRRSAFPGRRAFLLRP